MKTLIFNGSPRKNGNTASLISELCRQLDGEYKVVSAYYCNVKPCIDCRYCWKHEGCAIKDEMQEIYDYIQECDNVVIASPTHFSELTGQLLAVFSRLQTYWCAKYLRKEEPVPKKKRGGIIIVRGGEGELKKGINTAKAVLSEMNAKAIDVIFSDNSDEIASVDKEDVMEGIKKLAADLNSPVE